MKGLSITQPWATLVALGHKRIETRSWATNYTGPVAIHASKGFPGWAKEFAEEERALGRVPARIPLGAIIAIGNLQGCRRTEDSVSQVSGLERRLGDFEAGRFGWIFTDVVPLKEPIPCAGALGLWKVLPELLIEIRKQAPPPLLPPGGSGVIPI